MGAQNKDVNPVFTKRCNLACGLASQFRSRPFLA